MASRTFGSIIAGAAARTRAVAARGGAGAAVASSGPPVSVVSHVAAGRTVAARWFSALPSAPRGVIGARDISTTGAVAAQTKEDVGPLDELVRDFVPPAAFYDALGKRGVDFFTGVPDSLLKDFCAYVTDNAPRDRHVIAANEGSAVALAAGYHMATGNVPLVYLQNSGLGNTVNPLLSLADSKVYSIPMLLLIGWRGEPGKKDEPQHRVQGQLTPGMLASMGIQFEVLPDYVEGVEETLDSALDYTKRRNSPFALLVKRQTFEQYKLVNKESNPYELNREDALRVALKALDDWDVVVGTTGFTSREVFELREQWEQGHERDFLTVGSMGHASAIAMGVALAKPSRQVFTFDGDGALIMHMGNMASVGLSGMKNFKHIVLNNGSHDSVGAQPTGALAMDIPTIAKGCGYKETIVASTAEEIEAGIAKLRVTEGPALLELRVKPGARKDLGRPTTTTLENKKAFMDFLRN